MNKKYSNEVNNSISFDVESPFSLEGGGGVRIIYIPRTVEKNMKGVNFFC